MTAKARVGALLGAVAMVTVLGACGGDDGGLEDLGGGKDGDFEIETDDGNAKVDLDDGDFKVETDDGSFSASSDGDLPDEFPEDFPMPDGAKVQFSGSGDSGGGDGGVVVAFTVDDSVGDVFDFFIDELPKAGYRVVQKTTSEDPASGSIVFEGEHNGLIFLGEESGATTVTVTLEA